jgi:hypothetical protein
LSAADLSARLSTTDLSAAGASTSRGCHSSANGPSVRAW